MNVIQGKPLELSLMKIVHEIIIQLKSVFVIVDNYNEVYVMAEMDQAKEYLVKRLGLIRSKLPRNKGGPAPSAAGNNTNMRLTAHNEDEMMSERDRKKLLKKQREKEQKRLAKEQKEQKRSRGRQRTEDNKKESLLDRARSKSRDLRDRMRSKSRGGGGRSKSRPRKNEDVLKPMDQDDYQKALPKSSLKTNSKYTKKYSEAQVEAIVNAVIENTSHTSQDNGSAAGGPPIESFVLTSPTPSNQSSRLGGMSKGTNRSWNQLSVGSTGSNSNGNGNDASASLLARIHAMEAQLGIEPSGGEDASAGGNGSKGSSSIPESLVERMERLEMTVMGSNNNNNKSGNKSSSGGSQKSSSSLRNRLQ